MYIPVHMIGSISSLLLVFRIARHLLKSSKIWIISGWFLLSRRYIIFLHCFFDIFAVLCPLDLKFFSSCHIYFFTMTCSQFLSKQFLLIRNYVLPCKMLIMVISFKIALKFVIWILLLSNLQYNVLSYHEANRMFWYTRGIYFNGSTPKIKQKHFSGTIF